MKKNSLPLGIRAVSALLLPIHILTLWPAQVWSAATVSSSLSREVVHVAPLTVPQATELPLTTPAPKQLSFSGNPSDAEFAICRIFAEPLLPMGGNTSVEENRSLARAIVEFAKNPVAENLGMFTEFLQANPDSAWRVSLQTNLGIIYRRNGYWTRAMAAWKDAWESGQRESEYAKRLIVDQAVSSYAEMVARLGRTDELEALVAEIGSRALIGPATERYRGARESLFLEKTQPERSFRCGPFALGSILLESRPENPMTDEVMRSTSTERGTSLKSLDQLAKKWGLKYQVAYRSAGAKVITPAVVHWKAGHYAALTKELSERYLVQDPTFTDTISVTRTELDQEASGYFLVPAGELPEGWKTATLEEADTIWGKGEVPPSDPPAPPCETKKIKCEDGKCLGMAQWNVDPARVNLMMRDTPLSYAPPVGPEINFSLAYSHRDIAPSGNANYPNLGPKWSFDWVSFIRDNPSGDPSYQNVKSYGPGGGERKFSGYNANTGEFAIHYRTQAKLTRTSANSYEYVKPDGSRYVYDLVDSSAAERRIFLTAYFDPRGQKVTFGYDGNFRLVTVADATNRVTTLSYVSDDIADSVGYYRVKKVTDWAGRFAELKYYDDPARSGFVDDGPLWKIIDTAGMASEFTYSAGTDLIQKLTTPYGDTTFAVTDDANNDRTIVITDPNGAQEKVQFKYNMTPPDQASLDATLPSASGFLATTGYTNFRTSYYWDKKAYGEGSTDYSKAHLMHWLHKPLPWNPSLPMEPTLESEKRPLENRVYYNYPGQTDPSYIATSNLPTKIARKLDDGTTQLTEYAYNAQGNITKKVEPLNPESPVTRTTTYEYAANGIDLLAVYQWNSSGQSTDAFGHAADKVASYTYNGQHQPLTVTDISGQTTTLTYDALGQVKTVTNAKNETTTLSYYSSDQLSGGNIVNQRKDRLETIDGPLAGTSDVTAFDYDAFGRPSEVKSPEGYTVVTTYEAIGGDSKVTLNRPAKTYYGVIWNGDHTSFTSNGYEEVTYDRLDVEWTRDRKGRWSRNWYDANRHLIFAMDPLYRVTQYVWCDCGSLEAMVDPAGNRTTWFRDVQGRVTDKIYADNRGTHYKYEDSTSRLKSLTDAKGQIATYSYYPDNRVQSVTYTNSAIATPATGYTYDSVYGRPETITANEVTETTFTYNPVTAPAQIGAGRIATVDGPLADDTISYTYDELGRVLSRSINGAANTASVTYDSLGRVSTATNPLTDGATPFTFAYEGVSGRVDYLDYPNGQRVDYSYWGIAAPAGTGNGDMRLRQIKNTNQAGTTVFSQFDYEYDLAGQITKWTQNNSGFTHPQVWGLGYDDANQLTSGVLQEDVTNAVLKENAYRYDSAGNRTVEQVGSQVTTATHNALNQLKTLSGGGLMLFTGTVDEPASITLGAGSDATAATVDVSGTWRGTAKVTTGANSIPLTATDASGMTTNKTITVTVSGGAGSLYYDLNGNLTDDGVRTYEWDAKNQLVAINYTGTNPAKRSEFTYDGQGRRLKIVEKTGTTVDSTKQFVWEGLSIAEERDASNAVTKRFYGFGEQRGTAKYFYTRDHLGSVREYTDSTGAVQARYDYDLWGKRVKTAGTFSGDFGFTGHYKHSPSGLYLAPYRAYSSDLGRWINRDPIQELGGLNLYGYVGNDPVNLTDALGLWFSYETGTPRFWAHWREQFVRRWQDPVFRDWWNHAASCRDRYRIGPTTNPTLPVTTRLAGDGSSAVVRGGAVTDPQGANITHYGNAGDPFTDSGTRLGLGNHNNILNQDSVALSPDEATRLHLRVGDPVVINNHFIGYYQDSTAPNLTNRVDLYDPHGTEH